MCLGNQLKVDWKTQSKAKFFFVVDYRCEHLDACYWTCQSCGGVFPDLESFKVHLVKVHKMARECFALDDPEENPLLRPCLTIKEDVRQCPECEAEFGNKTSLNVHR